MKRTFYVALALFASAFVSSVVAYRWLQDLDHDVFTNEDLP